MEKSVKGTQTSENGTTESENNEPNPQAKMKSNNSKSKASKSDKSQQSHVVSRLASIDSKESSSKHNSSKWPCYWSGNHSDDKFLETMEAWSGEEGFATWY